MFRPATGPAAVDGDAGQQLAVGLYHLIRFFLRQDAHLAERGILSLRARFEEAMREDPSSLSPDVLYPVIDATTVKRTRSS